VFVTPLCSKPLQLVIPQLPENFLRQWISIEPTPAAARREPRRLKALSARPHRPGPVPSDRTAVITPFRRSTDKCLYYCAVEPWHVSHRTRRVGPLTSQTSPKRRSPKFSACFVPWRTYTRLTLEYAAFIAQLELTPREGVGSLPTLLLGLGPATRPTDE
jgi:hypothetical protein